MDADVVVNLAVAIAATVVVNVVAVEKLLLLMNVVVKSAVIDVAVDVHVVAAVDAVDAAVVDAAVVDAAVVDADVVNAVVVAKQLTNLFKRSALSCFFLICKMKFLVTKKTIHIYLVHVYIFDSYYS